MSVDISKERLEQIRLAAPGPVAKHLNKRISLPISRRLAQRGIHPNLISIVNMVFGVSSGFFVAKGTYLFYLLGGFIFQMASVFDGCDGEVAKLTNKISKLGEWLDTISDNGALLSFFTGLMIAFAGNHTPSVTGAMASLFIAGLGGLFFQIITFLKATSQSASLVTFDKEYLSKLPDEHTFLTRLIRYGKILMRKDCFSLMFFLSAVAGFLPVWIYIATFGLWIANGVLLWLKIKQKRFSFLTSTAP